MALLVVATLIVSIGVLYRTAIREEKLRLTEIAVSQARLIEAIAGFDKKYSNDYPLSARQATLSQIREAHSRYQGFGTTGEFTLAEKKNEQIVFLLNHRHYDLDNPKPVPWKSTFAEPMRLALSGKSGVTTGLDYRGEKVIAAHEPVSGLNLGIVAKIDLSEVQAPFFRAALITTIFAAVFIVFGVSIFFKVTNPILTKLNRTVENLQGALREVKVLRGILPICSFCKKIRDDHGNWNQVEAYIKGRSNAEFSHSVCPDCMKKHYSEYLSSDTDIKADDDATNHK